MKNFKCFLIFSLSVLFKVLCYIALISAGFNYAHSMQLSYLFWGLVNSIMFDYIFVVTHQWFKEYVKKNEII